MWGWSCNVQCCELECGRLFGLERNPYWPTAAAGCYYYVYKHNAIRSQGNCVSGVLTYVDSSPYKMDGS